jgi:hypothetical protein
MILWDFNFTPAKQCCISRTRDYFLGHNIPPIIWGTLNLRHAFLIVEVYENVPWILTRFYRTTTSTRRQQQYYCYCCCCWNYYYHYFPFTSTSTVVCSLWVKSPLKKRVLYNQFIYSNRDVYIVIALCNKLLHSAIAIAIRNFAKIWKFWNILEFYKNLFFWNRNFLKS